jgi:CrcB protein
MKYEMLAVGVGGTLGSLCRYLVYVWMGSRTTGTFPYATVGVNIAGCFLIGLIGGILERHFPGNRILSLSLTVGFLGSFTTFSAFGLETLNLMRGQAYAYALWNVLANVLIGLLAVWLGTHCSKFDLAP